MPRAIKVGYFKPAAESVRLSADRVGLLLKSQEIIQYTKTLSKRVTLDASSLECMKINSTGKLTHSSCFKRSQVN